MEASRYAGVTPPAYLEFRLCASAGAVSGPATAFATHILAVFSHSCPNWACVCLRVHVCVRDYIIFFFSD